MTSTTDVLHVFVVHLDWGSFSNHEPIITAFRSEPNAYVHTADFLACNAHEWLDEDMQETYDAFLSDFPYDPGTATPEQAKEWVNNYAETDLYPLVTVKETQVLP
ncbi:hypothetical protein AB0G05_27370 [Nonomuraea wenchangensis]